MYGTCFLTDQPLSANKIGKVGVSVLLFLMSAEYSEKLQRIWYVCRKAI